jgi:dTDP-4-amino-4,6-dideoxygalactose transaminase/organic radical activating enzyme
MGRMNMDCVDNASIKRPWITKKYERKIRLLVTNACPNNCEFCHNEGMPKGNELYLCPSELGKILHSLKAYSNRVVLSGGEPLEYTYLSELVLLLEKHGFDISIDTSLPKLDSLNNIMSKLNSVHISIPDISVLSEVEVAIEAIHHEYAMLQLVLNVPVVSTSRVCDEIPHLYKICKKNNARLQFIRLFDLNVPETSVWGQRWIDIRTAIGMVGVTFLESTNREVSFVSEDLIQIDLVEIPCVASGYEFRYGKCLNDSDITIDPNMCLSICRWTNSSINIAKNHYDIETIIAEAFNRSCNNCIFEKTHDFLYPDSIKKYMALPHYKWPPVLDESISACNILLQHSTVSYYGKNGYIHQLENEFANYYGVPYAFATSSGTVAVYLSCIALGLRPDDEVIVPTYTFPTVITAIISSGAKIRVCDSNAITGNIDIESFHKNITKDVKAVIVTHLWGDPADLSELTQVCTRNDIKIIEDCSHAYGAEYQGRKVGTYGDIACFSMQANKAVFSGEGGMVITSNQCFYERIIVHASSQRRVLDCIYNREYRQFWETGLGLKLKMHPLGAPIALEALHNLNSINLKRNLRAEMLNNSIAHSCVFLGPSHDELGKKRVYYTYKPLLADGYIEFRDMVLDNLISYGLEVTSSSFIPLHKTPLYTHNRIVKGHEQFEGANRYYERVLSFPAFVNEPEDLIEFYAEKLIASQSEIDGRGGILHEVS